MKKLIDEKNIAGVDTGYCYANVKKWMINRFLASKLKLQDYDRVFNIVNLHNTHWTLLVVRMKEKIIEY